MQTILLQLLLAVFFKMLAIVFTANLSVLLLSLVFKSIHSYIQIPVDVFIPSMTIGALVGRMVGISVETVVVRSIPRNHIYIIYANDCSHIVTGFTINTACPVASECIAPGLYAIVGAAAVFSGVTRMTGKIKMFLYYHFNYYSVSLVVILFELTGARDYILPLMLVSSISKMFVIITFNELSIDINNRIADALHRDGMFEAL